MWGASSKNIQGLYTITVKSVVFVRVHILFKFVAIIRPDDMRP